MTMNANVTPFINFIPKTVTLFGGQCLCTEQSRQHMRTTTSTTTSISIELINGLNCNIPAYQYQCHNNQRNAYGLFNTKKKFFLLVFVSFLIQFFFSLFFFVGIEGFFHRICVCWLVNNTRDLLYTHMLYAPQQLCFSGRLTCVLL